MEPTCARGGNAMILGRWKHFAHYTGHLNWGLKMHPIGSQVKASATYLYLTTEINYLHINSNYPYQWHSINILISSLNFLWSLARHYVKAFMIQCPSSNYRLRTGSGKDLNKQSDFYF